MSLFQWRKLIAAATAVTAGLAVTGCSTTSGSAADASSYPAKGRTVTLIVPYDAGGAGDVGARLLAPYLSDELGAKITIENDPGAGSQIGVSKLARSKPDGYTLGFTHLPATITTYLDPERKADFTLSNLAPIGMYVIDPTAFAVKGDSKYNSLDDLIADAKAHPGKIRITDSGVLSDGHITVLELEKLTGAKFAIVHGDGGAANVTNILGGNTDVGNLNISGNTAELVNDGQIKLLAIFDSKPDPHFPGVKTGVEQGYNIIEASSRAISAPAGTPKTIINKVSSALERAMKDPKFVKKADAAGLRLTYMNPNDLLTYWKKMEKSVKPLIALAR